MAEEGMDDSGINGEEEGGEKSSAAGSFSSEERGNMLLVTLERPPVNAFDIDLLEQGADTFRRLGSNMPDGGVVLTGAGSAFTAGLDKAEIAAIERDYLRRQRLNRAINRFVAALYRLPGPLVVAVNGHALGLGAIMCLCADWVIAADDERIRIGLPEAEAGFPFPPVPLTVLRHQLDPVWRRRLALTSYAGPPEQALLSGLADETVEPGDLAGTALERVQELSAQPAFNPIKASLRQPAQREIDAILA